MTSNSSCISCGLERTLSKTCRCYSDEHDFDNECNNCGECMGDKQSGDSV